MSTLAALLGLITLSVPHWGLNDVSFLMPLADPHASQLLLKADTRGSQGELLPLEVFTRLPPLSFYSPETSRRMFRAVGVRIDPCFLDAAASSKCRRQIRLVWQPVVTEQTGARAEDVAIHEFFELSAKDFERLVAELDQLRNTNPALKADALRPLGVHPVFARQGLKGPFYTSFRRIILQYIGESRISRVTFMRSNPAGSAWTFGGLDFDRGQSRKTEIARIGAKVQVFMNIPLSMSSTLMREFGQSGITPQPQGVDDLSFIVRNSNEVRESMDQPRIISSVISAARLENPRTYRVEHVDCVSCHVAQPARLWADKAFPELSLTEKISGAAYSSTTQPLKNVSPAQDVTTNIRAFGFFGKLPAVSQRAIHESAEVADVVNESLRMKKVGFAHY